MTKLNAQTAHTLRIGDTLTLNRTGEWYIVTAIIPCGSGYRITVADKYRRHIYGEKASLFYGFIINEG